MEPHVATRQSVTEEGLTLAGLALYGASCCNQAEERLTLAGLALYGACLSNIQADLGWVSSVWSLMLQPGS